MPSIYVGFNAIMRLTRYQSSVEVLKAPGPGLIKQSPEDMGFSCLDEVAMMWKEIASTCECGIAVKTNTWGSLHLLEANSPSTKYSLPAYQVRASSDNVSTKIDNDTIHNSDDS